MGNKTSTQRQETLHRVNTRIFGHQDAFIKNEVKKSKGVKSEGEIHRELLDEAIKNRKAKIV